MKPWLTTALVLTLTGGGIYYAARSLPEDRTATAPNPYASFPVKVESEKTDHLDLESISPDGYLAATYRIEQEQGAILEAASVQAVYEDAFNDEVGRSSASLGSLRPGASGRCRLGPIPAKAVRARLRMRGVWTVNHDGVSLP